MVIAHFITWDNILYCIFVQKYTFRLRYFIALSYKGTPYHGWQRQPNAITVQAVVEDALSLILRTKMGIMGAGRTDTGVHATQLVAHFDTEKALDVAIMKYKLNAILPAEIAVNTIKLVTTAAHARFDAIARTYHYKISLKKDPFLIDRNYYIRKPLDVEQMNIAAKILLEYTNFKCFSKSKTDVKTYHCTITKAFWEVQGEELVFIIKANRFLRNMVRAIVGTLVEIGLHKIPAASMHNIIKSEDRSAAGYSVPAHGLYLVDVQYPASIYK